MRQHDSISSGVPGNLSELRVYHEAQACAATVAAAVAGFPAEERFALADQMRRASSSVYANIAEGHARTSAREQVRFYGIARSSLIELRAHIDQAVLRELIASLGAADLQRRAVHVDRLLLGLIRATERPDTK